LSQLDGIRGLAIAIVVIHHSIANLGIGNERNLSVAVTFRLLHPGWLGVDIFFVLSGFLVTGIIRKERTYPDFWGAFYTRRGFRILPAFFAVFVVTLVAAHLFAPALQGSWAYILAAVFFMANWTVAGIGEMPMLNQLWSLAIEEQFYLLWPQVARRLKIVTLFEFSLLLAVGCEILRIALSILRVNPYVVYKITPTRIDGLAVGAALAIGITLPAVHRFLAVWWRRIAVASILFLTFSFLSMRGSLFAFNGWSQVLAVPPTIVLTAMLIYGVVESALPAGLARFFGSPIMTYLGRRSYAIYLIHVPMDVAVEVSRSHGLLQRLPKGVSVNAALILSAIAVSLGLAEVSWRLIESPAQALRWRWMQGKEHGTVAHPPEEMEIVQLAQENKL
jgi:peptidoglycan/LPS O-acetylase OafA/YrhL